MTPYIVFGVTYAFAAAVQPGPFQAWIVSQALTRGWRRALPAAFAPVLSDIPVIAIVLTVLSRVPQQMILGLQLAGGLLLFWLAFGAYRSWRDFAPAGAAVGIGSDRRTFLQAVAVNLLGPGPWLGWSLIMGPLFLKGWHEAPAHGLALVVSFYLTMVTTLVAMVALFAGARRLGPRVNRASIAVSAIALAAFGFWQIWRGLQGFLA